MFGQLMHQNIKLYAFHKINVNHTWYPNKFSGNLSSFSSVNLRLASSRLSPSRLTRLLLELTLVDALDAVALTD